MKVYVYEDEAFPVYGIDRNLNFHEKFVEIPDELYERYVKVEREYEEVQVELSEYSCE